MALSNMPIYLTNIDNTKVSRGIHEMTFPNNTISYTTPSENYYT